MKQQLPADLLLAVSIGKNLSESWGFGSLWDWTGELDAAGNTAPHISSHWNSSVSQAGLAIEAFDQSIELTAEGDCFIYNSLTMEDLVTRAVNRCRDGLPILIRGENGVGKKLLAHHLAQRLAVPKPSCQVYNCATADPSVMDQVLRSLSADDEDVRSVETPVFAKRGIIFLTEMQALAPDLQVRLSAVLARRESRVYDAAAGAGHAQLIALMNVPSAGSLSGLALAPALAESFEDGCFTLPPLRDRPEDILLLAAFFLEKYKYLSGGRPCRLSREARESLLTHPWPGNVRMLENVILRSLVLHDPGQEISTLFFHEPS